MTPQEQALELRTEADTFIRAHRYDEAYESAKKAVNILRALGESHGLSINLAHAVVSDDVEVRRFWRELAFSIGCRARALNGRGEIESSLKDHDVTIQLLSTFGMANDGVDYDDDLARALHNRSNCLLIIATPDALKKAFDGSAKSIDIRENLLAREGDEYVAADLAGTYKQRASILKLLRMMTEAEADAKRGVEIREDLVTREGWTHLNPILAMTRYTYADILGAQFKFDPCLSELEKAISVLRQEISRGGLHFRSDLLYCLTAKVLYSQGAIENAGRNDYPVSTADECMKLFDELCSEGRSDLLPLYFEFVGQRGLPCVLKAGDVKRAVRYVEHALNVVEHSGASPAHVRQAAKSVFAVPDGVMKTLFDAGLEKSRFFRVKQSTDS